MANAQGNETIHPSSSAACAPPSQRDEMGNAGFLQKCWGGGLAGLRRASRSHVKGGCQPGLWKCVIVAIILNNLNDISVHDSKALVWEAVEVIGNDSPQWCVSLKQQINTRRRRHVKSREERAGEGWAGGRRRRRADVEGKEGKRCGRAEQW